MVSRYPHSGTIFFMAGGTVNSIGHYTEGTPKTIVVSSCNVQPYSAKAGYVVNPHGDTERLELFVTAKKFTNYDTVPRSGAKFQFQGRDYIIQNFFAYQNHVEWEC